MKYSKNLTVIIAIIAIAFTSTSCKKDKEDPTIEVTTPAMHSEFKWGDEVHIEATFADDQGLKNYTVMVVDEDGNHEMTVDFMKSGTTTELTYDFHEHFVVPTDAPMMAWIQFTVTDADDKTTSTDWMIHFEE